MENQIIKYFNAEKIESLFFIGVGCGAFICAAWFFFQNKDDFFKGMIIPLLFVGAIQLIVGSTVFLRSNKDIAVTQTYLASGVNVIQSRESARMDIVMKNFVIYKWIEIAFILTGIVLLVAISDFDYWKGFGLALLLQGSIMLVLDIFAEKRGAEYLTWIQNLVE